MNSLAGRVAYITGAARGRGRAEAIRLAAMGADIIALDLAAPLTGLTHHAATVDDFQQTVIGVEQLGRRIITGIGDVRDIETQREFVDEAVAEFGGLDIVVANAGICVPQAWDQITPGSFASHLDVNVVGTWNTVMVCAPHLIERGGGSVVLTSPPAGTKDQPFMVHSAASEHAVTGMARAFAAELGRHNIRVNSVQAGPTRTGQSLLPSDADDAQDVANAVAFLVSDEASRITAEHLGVAAGMQYS